MGLDVYLALAAAECTDTATSASNAESRALADGIPSPRTPCGSPQKAEEPAAKKARTLARGRTPATPASVGSGSSSALVAETVAEEPAAADVELAEANGMAETLANAASAAEFEGDLATLLDPATQAEDLAKKNAAAAGTVAVDEKRLGDED